MKKPRIILYDIETSLSVLSGHSLWNPIPHTGVLKDWYVICVCWKVLGEKTIHHVVVDKKDYANDYKLIKKFRDVLLDADIIVGHNADKFDLKKLQTRMLIHGMEPLPKIPSVDTLKIAKKEFSFLSNRLDYIAQTLKVGKKLDNPRGLWDSALQGDMKAINQMVKYCKVDVEILEGVYKKFLPHIKNHPNSNLFVASEGVKATGCRNCGSQKIHYRGYQTLSTGKYKRYVCTECGSWGRENKAVVTSTSR